MKIYIPDPTYDHEDYERKSRRFKKTLASEYKLQFEEANIGPSVDIPAFVTSISTADWPYFAGLIAFFFSGKLIRDNFEAWADIGNAISKFFKHKPSLEPIL